jgi:hypothetical protein
MLRPMAVAAVAGGPAPVGGDRKENYRQAGNPPGQNPKGTPADRTGAPAMAPPTARAEDRRRIPTPRIGKNSSSGLSVNS